MLPLAIVTATPPGINPGMLACEATALAFVRHTGLADACTFFRLHLLEERVADVEAGVRQDVLTACDLGIPWERLHDHRQLDGMVPLYWGDFLHMRRYHAALAARYADGMRTPRELLLLAFSAEHVVRRAVTFGTSFLFNSLEDVRDPDYGAAFSRFIKLAHHVQMRDAISAAVAAGLRLRHEACFGIDPAQLLALPAFAVDVLGSDDRRAPDGRMLLFLARARHDATALTAFLEILELATGTTAAWLPWGDRLSFPFLGEPAIAAVTSVVDGPHGRLAPLMREVRQATFVVTDTYHLAVIAWALGVPAIVVAGEFHAGERGDKQIELRARHDKRKVLLGQDGLLDFYVEPGMIAAAKGRASVAERLAAALADPLCGSDARQRVAARASFSIATLHDALTTARSAPPLA